MAGKAATELVQNLKAQLQNCGGFGGDELDKHRRESMAYYFQRRRGDEVAGRSQVVAGDESAMVEANLAQMLDAYTSDRICEYHSRGAVDKQQAQYESDAVTYFVMGANNGWLVLSSAIKDALQMRLGVVKAWIEKRRRVRYETYTKVDALALAELLNRDGLECKVLNTWTPEEGRLELRCYWTDKRFRVEGVPVECFLYPKNWSSHDLQSIPFCAEWHLDSRADLIALGFPEKKVNKLAAVGQPPNRGEFRNPQEMQAAHRSADKSQDLIEWYEIYTLLDKDGDGIAERRRMALVWKDNELLEDEPVNVVPYGAGNVLLNQHRLTGIDLHDKLKQTSDKHTGLERALLDNVNATSKNRTASLDGVVNDQDLADGRVNGNLRVNRRLVADVRQAVMAFTIPDTSANILANIQAVKAERAELGGAALDMSSGNMQLNDRMGSEGVDRVYSVMEQLAAYMTRNIGHTLIRSVWLVAHATLREQWNEPVPLEAAEGIQPVPSKWLERLCVTVKPGMSPGERQRLANALAKTLDWQVSLAREGMDEVLVYIDGFYKALMDWGRVVEIPHPEQYYRNPASPEAMQAIKDKKAAAQQIEQQKRELMQQAVGLEQLRTAFDKYRQDTELVYKYWAKVMDVQVKEAEIVGRATTELLSNEQRDAAANGAPPAAANTDGGGADAGGGGAGESAAD